LIGIDLPMTRGIVCLCERPIADNYTGIEMSSSITSYGNLHVVERDGILAAWMFYGVQVLTEMPEREP